MSYDGEPYTAPPWWWVLICGILFGLGVWLMCTGNTMLIVPLMVFTYLLAFVIFGES